MGGQGNIEPKICEGAPLCGSGLDSGGITEAMSDPQPTWKVLAFAGVAQSLGCRELELPKQANTNATKLKAMIVAHTKRPELATILESCRIAVDHTMIAGDELIAMDATELALIPPVSGGMNLPRHLGECSVLSKAPLSSDQVIAAVSHENAGGINVFIGNVRKQSRGLTVTHLEYEAYPDMAVKAMDAICKAIEQEIDGAKVCIHHRYGRLDIGEAAVIIAASAPHRAPAFDACRKAIERLKQDVPIWKKEFDEDGGTWIGQGP